MIEIKSESIGMKSHYVKLKWTYPDYRHRTSFELQYSLPFTIWI